MITVAGFNTAVDRRLDIDTLQPGAVQRAVSASAVPGGKGLHVAQTVVALGEPASLVGLGDAAHDDLLRSHLQVRGVAWHGIRVSQDLRQCLAIHETSGRVTEILEPGPELSASVGRELLAGVEALLEDAQVLVLSGSLPPGLGAGTYARLIRKAKARDVPCLLDASGDALCRGIEAGPWLVKPNADEASALWGKPVQGIDDAVACARWLHARGLAQVVITLGGQGAVGFDGDNAWHAQLSAGEVRNSVGSGDCFMAGLAVSIARGQSLGAAMRCATACGTANAQNEETGFASREQVDALFPQVRIRPVDNGQAHGASVSQDAM